MRASINLPMRVLLASLLLLFASPVFATASGQLRGLWVDAYGPGFKSPQEIDTLVSDAKALGLNALFVQVVRRGDCYCLRSKLPVSDDPALTPGFDPLALLLERAHAAGIQVHAWVVTLALWGADAPPTSPEHVYNLHGPNAPSGESWLNLRYDGVTRPERDVYLDPGVPAVADYLSAAVVSLAQNYDLDGVTFDRLRYPDFNLDDAPSWGYNGVSLARYAAETREETGAVGLPHPSDPTWTVWRRRQLSLLERRLYLELKRANPALWVGSATVAYGAPPESFANSVAHRLVLQDWAGWLKNGFLDLNIPMNYKRFGDAREEKWFQAWNRYAPTLTSGGVTAVGLGLYQNEPTEVQAQVEDVLKTPGLSGWVGYSYRTPSAGTDAGLETAETARAALGPLLSTVTLSTATVSTATAFGRPPPVTALLGRVEADKPENVELLRSGKVVATSPTDANGVYGFVLPASASVQTPAEGYLLRLSGGVAVPVSLRTGTVARAPTLTRSPAWYLAEDQKETSQTY